jgi:predicted ArsR family transcriptional regulator
MDGWWDEVHAVVQKCLDRRGEVTAAEVATNLGVSEAAATSLLGLLAAEGNIRITRIAGRLG